MAPERLADNAVVQRLPLPLAQLYRRAHNAKNPRDAHDCAMYLWEAGIRLLASSAIVVTAANDRLDTESFNRLQVLNRPTLGHWREIIRLLLPKLASEAGFRVWCARIDEPTPDLPDCAQLENALRREVESVGQIRQVVRIGELFDQIVAYRNRASGHGAPAAKAGDEFRSTTNLLLAAGSELFGKFDVLTGRRLIAVTEVRSVRDNWLVERVELRGVAPWRIASLEFPGRESPPPVREAVFLLEQQSNGNPEKPLSLYPWLDYEPQRESAYFFNRLRGRSGADFLCFDTGDLKQVNRLDPVENPALAKFLDVATAESVAVEEPVAPAATGERQFVGDYELLEILGRGAMGVVYRARQIALGRQVAIKTQRQTGDPKTDGRFQREIRSLARVDHPNLIKVYTSGFDQGQFYFTMELLEGKPLSAVGDALTTRHAGEKVIDLRAWCEAIAGPPGEADSSTAQTVGNRPALDQACVRRIVELVQSVAEAAHALHEAGVLHRDIKPGNILVSPDGNQAVLLDLGLAQLADDVDGRLTRTRQFVGTLRYASPQQASGNLTLDRRADIYSLGATLWELLSLRPLFDATDDMSTDRLMDLIQRGEPRRLSSTSPAIGRDLEAIVHKCLEKEPDRRYPTAKELAEDLQRWLDQEPVKARPVQAWERGWKWMKRRPAVAASLLLLGLLLVAGIVGTGLLAKAYHDERQANVKALVNEQRARGAIDDYLLRLNQDDTLKDPRLSVLRMRLLQDGLRHHEEFVSAEQTRNDPAMQELTAGAHRRIGSIQQMLEQFGPAVVALNQSVSLYRQLLVERPGEAELLKELAQAQLSLAELKGRSAGPGNRDAEYCYREALAQLQPLISGSDADAETLSLAGRVHASYSDHVKANDLAAAIAHARESLQFRQRAAALKSDDSIGKQDLADGYIRLGVLLNQSGSLADSLSAYSSARKTLKTIRDNSFADQAIRIEAKLIHDSSVLHRQLGDDQAARRELEQAIAQRRQILYRQSAQPLLDLAQSLNDYGAVLRAMKQRDAALDPLLTAMEHRRLLAAANPDDRTCRLELLRSYQTVGNFYSSDPKSFGESLKWLQAGLDEFDRSPEAWRQTADFRTSRGTILLIMGGVHVNRQEAAEAAAAFEAAESSFGELARQFPAVRAYRLSRARALALLANLAVPPADDADETGKSRAIARLDSALDLCRGLLDERPNDADAGKLESSLRPALLARCSPLIASYRAQRRPDKAVATARLMVKWSSNDATRLVAAAGELAECLSAFPGAEVPPSLRIEIANEAIGALKRARAIGLKSLPDGQKSKFAALSEYPEFRKFLTELTGS